MVDVKQLIKGECKKQGIMLQDLAKRIPNNVTGEIGVSNVYLSAMLSRNFTLSKLEEVANALGKTVRITFEDPGTFIETPTFCPHCGKRIMPAKAEK